MKHAHRLAAMLPRGAVTAAEGSHVENVDDAIVIDVKGLPIGRLARRRAISRTECGKLEHGHRAVAIHIEPCTERCGC